MVLRLSDLVKKSIDKGYGSASHAIEKPWSQGNLSLIDLKTDKNPFVKTIPAADAHQTKMPQPSVDKLPEDNKAQNTSLEGLKNRNDNDINLDKTSPQPLSKHLSNKNWWEKIMFPDQPEPTQTMRLLVNYNLVHDE